MTYTKVHADWEDYPSTQTPITEAALEQIEQGIEDAHALAGPTYFLPSATPAGYTTFTLDRDVAALAHKGWFVIEPFASNCEVVRAESIITNTVTVPTISLTASNIAFDSVTKKISGTAESISKFFPGEKIVVTGSTSNDGTYTVAAYPTDGSYDGTYITTVEALADESAGASVTVKLLTRAHASGSTVLFTQGPIPVTLYGAKASGSTGDAPTNRAAIQRCLNDSYYYAFWDVYFPGFMAGRYYIDGPLYWEKLTHLRGPHHKGAIIAATSAFATWNDDVAMVQSRRNGLVCRKQNGGNDRYHMTGLGLDGVGAAYLKSAGFSGSNFTGTGYTPTGTNTFAIHATLANQGSNRIAFRAIAGGTGGNSIRLEFVNNGASLPLTVSVSGNDITVQLATNSSSVVTSTANDVVAAVNAYGPAAALVEASIIGGMLGTNVVPAFGWTTVTAGTAPFVAGDVGRSLYVGRQRGARTITAYVDAYTVTVDGDAWTDSRAGCKWALSPVNGLMLSCNQTSRITDVRIEDCPGYGVLWTGTQECTVYNLMSTGNGVHVRLLGSQFVRFYESNFEKTVDAFVTFENVTGIVINRSISFHGTHAEGATINVDHYRVTSTHAESLWFVDNFWTVPTSATFLKLAGTYATTYGVLGMSFSGPNSGPIVIDDGPRGYTTTLTDYQQGNNYTVPLWVVGSGDEYVTNRKVQSKTAAYTVRPTDKLVLANATSGAFEVTLLSAVGIKGVEFTVKRTNSGANAVTVGTTSSQTIDGASTVTLAAQYERVTVASDGANWVRVD